MKLKFKKQQFQSDAVAAVVDLFKGQASSVSPFTVGKLDIIDYAQDSVFGYGNTLTLTAEEITRNLHEVQQRNLLPLTEPEQLRFNIEMERERHLSTQRPFMNSTSGMVLINSLFLCRAWRSVRAHTSLCR